MQGEHEHQPPTIPVVTPVVETGNELVAPVVDHAEKIVRIEERQAQHQQEMMRELGNLETRLQEATGTRYQELLSRIDALESRIAEEARPPESVEIDVPSVEPSPTPPEKIRQGLRHRRKAKRGKHE